MTDGGGSGRRRVPIMTLKVLPISGHSKWWIWSIVDDTGASVEESATQFRSPEAAARNGYARLGELE